MTAILVATAGDGNQIVNHHYFLISINHHYLQGLAPLMAHIVLMLNRNIAIRKLFVVCFRRVIQVNLSQLWYNPH
jgi:hypothetical protein